MKVSFFFRKKSNKKHSIELLFKTIQKYMPKEIQIYNYVSRIDSKGILRRLLSGLLASFSQGDINHITGDIHFIAAFLKSSKTILTIHDIEVLKRKGGIRKKIIKYFWFDIPIRKVQRITVISEFTKSELLKYYPQFASKIIVIPNCISDIYQRNKKEFNSTCPTILQIGTKQNKNLEGLIYAIKDIKCLLLIVGLLNQKQSRLLKELKINYKQYGHISINKMYNLYIECDILAFISTYEGFGLPILEAQSVGRPIISSNISSIPEVAGNAALLVNPYEKGEIRKALLKITEDDKFRAELVAKGFENVKRYSAETVANAYFNVYKECIKAKDLASK